MEKFDVIGRPAYGQPALVVVPKLGMQDAWANRLKPGSSMVAFRASGWPAMFVYYEGNMYGACNLKTFQERATNAYGRMAMSYPTTAMTADDTDSLEVIGTITQHGMEIEETEAYLAWIALDKTLVHEAHA
jgi:hypothetical protein